MRGLLLSGFLIFATITECHAVLDVPALSSPVIDDGDFYSSSEEYELAKLFQGKTGTAQFQVWTVKNLDGEAIESLSIRAAEKWKLGSAKQDNGLLILLSKQDRRMRIEVGQGLEGNIPDVIAGRVVDQIMKPYFRQEQYFEGTKQSAMYLYQRLENPNGSNDLAESQTRRKRSGLGSSPLFLILFVIIIIFRIISGLSRGFGPFRSRRRGIFDSGGGFWGGGGGGWGSGGGGWSGGGGGFSGGGSSGSW